MTRVPPRPEILSWAVDGSDLQVLGYLAPVSPPVYSFTLPGGCDQASFTMARSPRWRTRALDPGRKLAIALGGTIVWRGRQLEPTPGDAGWDITGQGSGTYGSLFQAEFAIGTGGWAANAGDTAVNRAISRGLDWKNPGIGSPAGLFTGQPNDSASVKIDDMLNQLCSNGGLTWQVAATAAGNVLSVFALPSTVNRVLVAGTPVARSLGGDINRVWLRYQSAPDINQNNPATFANTTTDDTPSQNRHGVTETFEDLSSSGTMTAGNAQAVGNFVLQRYQRASFADPFTVRYGQLLNRGGQPVELGCFYCADTSPAMMCQAVLLDYGQGGEVKTGAVKFLVGAYEYDSAAGTAQITPYQGIRTDFSQLMDLRVRRVRPRKTKVRWARTSAWRKGDKGKHRRPVWHFVS